LYYSPQALHSVGFLEKLNEGVKALAGTAQAATDPHLATYLAKKSFADTWMGTEYWKQQVYGNLDEMIDGFVESSTVYRYIFF
jgi:hypothetical protein